uniref:Alpha/beta hydrolase fold-3 domain-containing protein n=3 Tax=Canis lupus familiaris TaxID=9615 RepID=A0A8C0Q290_CANLF|eukprot:XP_544560.4 arylacetamide deacetylase-like 3 [Canis lupus familiaris]
MLWGWAGVEGRVWCISAGASPAPALARGRSRTASRRAAGAGAAMALLLLVLQAACAFSLGVGLWVVCSHLLRADVPAAVGHPVRLRVLHCLLELLITWGMILEKLRICSMPQFVRFVHDLVPLKEDPDVVVTDLLFGTVPVKLYQPKGLSCTPRPGIVFYHGGGAVMGSLKTHYAICCHLCKKSGSVVLAVGYRKLPQHKFPAALTDCFAATTHFLKSLNVYGVDPDRVVVCGDSVGGAVATVVCQKFLGCPDLPKIRAQILIYAQLQAVHFQLPSYQQNKNVPLASRDFAFYCWHRYLDIKPSWKSTVLKGAHLPAEVWEKYRKWLGTENIPERFKKRPYRPVLPEPLNEAAYLETSLALDLLNSPLIAEDEVISQLPEACIVSCEYDLLRDDSLLYKKRLEDLGVPVTWYHMEDGFHGVLSTLDMGCLQFPCSTRILDSLVHFLKRL